MSGFSSVVNTAANGMVNYDKNYSKAKEDIVRKQREKETYDRLVEQANQEKQIRNQTIDKNDQIIQQQDAKLNMLKDGIMKQSVDITKKDFTDKFNSFISTYKQYQGKLAKIENGEKSYTIPTDLNQSVKDMNNVIVHDPVGADWVNHFMDSQYGTMSNPIVNMSYRPETDELVLTQKSGREIAMSPALMYTAMGLQKYSTFRHTKEVEDLAKKSKALYDQNKAVLESTKVKTDLMDAETKRFDAETKRLKLKEEASKLLNGNSKEAIHGKLSKLHEISAGLLSNPSVTKQDVKPVRDKLMSSKDFTDTLKKDGIYDKVEKLKYFADKSAAMSDELNKLAEGARTGSFETINKLFLRFTGKGIKKEEYEKAQTFSTRMNLLIMDYLQYKSGAAFGKEELAGYQAAGGILDFNDPDMAKASVKGMSTYLRNKLASDIQSVPNANQRLVLEYDSGMIPSKSPINEFRKIKDRDKQKQYLMKLKIENPTSYEALKQELTNG